MIFRQLFDRESSTYSYLLADKNSAKALLIDPVKEHLEYYLQLLDELGLMLQYAIDTHVHADHVTALGALRDRTGCQTIVGTHSTMHCADRHIDDGEFINCGNLALTAIYTPGHTNDSYCFYLDEHDGYLFTGDTLLIRGTGRTDFQHGSSKDLYHSLFSKLLPLGDEVTVYPGHDYKGWTKTTIGEERKHNPRLQVRDWQGLAAILDNLKLADPKLMDIAIPANQSCGQPLGH
ncbi:Beta-lactamase hydrolase-like protein [Sinobacterium norvegicum]|uniref:Beta-lactamase hydrolase-like protein n=1 Tax=Sinobacterium norvegicum TaxID=1641715 RepID=A0ABM9AI27_9GAMM|nr:MBL fold metallo-hydrolase [Sinobacterium norvegicum]CAH0992408.1 Beta-lactamase hydrolase-like protein [Sinobacterium norvegicum]